MMGAPKKTDTEQFTFAVAAADAGERLDKTVAHHAPSLSRSRAAALIELGHVTLDTPKGSQTIKDVSAKVKPGWMITVIVPPVETSEIKAQAIALHVVYEDAHLLVINKEAGMTVHPAPGSPDSTLVNALLAHCGESLSGIGGVARPGIVHRIDKDTTGLLVVAKHDKAHHHLSAQLLERSLKRTYLAVCAGHPVPPAGTISGNIARHPRDRQRMAVVKSGGKHAVTHYKTVERLQGAALLECQLETGRTHQIRVHLSHINHPLLGDQSYGKKARMPAGIEFKRQALHAWKLVLIHPETNEAMQFEAPLPEDMRMLIEALRM